MANPLKVFTALSGTNGIEVSGSDGLKIKQGGISLSDGAGGITIAAGGGTLAAQGVTATTISGSSTLQIGGSATVAGAIVTLAHISASDTLEIGGNSTLGGSATVRNGLTVSGSTLTSGSVTIGGNGSLNVANSLTVSAGAIFAPSSQLTASNVSASAFFGSGAGLTGVTAAAVAANSVALGTGTTGNYVGDVTAGTGLTKSSVASEGQTVDLSISGASGLTSNALTKWNGTAFVNSNVTDNGTDVVFSTNITGTSAYFAGTIFAQTASIGVLNYISGASLTIGDKFITLASGASDHTSLDGSGILWGSGSAGSTHAHILYRATGDLLEISPNLSSSNISGSNLTVTNTSNFKGAVTLGDAVSDIIAVSGSLTASQGLDLGAEKGITINNSKLVSKNQELVTENFGAYDALSHITGAVINGPYSNLSSNTFIKLSYVSESFSDGFPGYLHDLIKIQTTGSTEGNGSAVEVSDTLVGMYFDATKTMAKANSRLRLNATNAELRGSGSVTLRTGRTDAGSILLGASSEGVYSLYNGSNFANIKEQPGGAPPGTYYLNLATVLDALSSSISSSMGAAAPAAGTVTTSSYYNIRSTRTGSVQTLGYDVEFLFSGSGDAGDGTVGTATQYYFKAITGLSASNASALIDLLSYASFDVAVQASGTTSWTNDLVSVTVTASNSSSVGGGVTSGYFFPRFIVSAPSLAANSKIRLIVVNEKSGVL